MKSKTKIENQIQAQALGRMKGNVLDLIALYANDFRQIISEFESMHNRVPTADDLIWIESERKGRDVTEDY